MTIKKPQTLKTTNQNVSRQILMRANFIVGENGVQHSRVVQAELLGGHALLLKRPGHPERVLGDRVVRSVVRDRVVHNLVKFFK